MSEVAPKPAAEASESARRSATRAPAPGDDALAMLQPLQQELELARAREARLTVDNHRLAEALEQAERQLADLATLREEAEVGRRARDAALRLQVLETSSSWRLTRPLRLVSMALRRRAGSWRQRS